MLLALLSLAWLSVVTAGPLIKGGTGKYHWLAVAHHSFSFAFVVARWLLSLVLWIRTWISVEAVALHWLLQDCHFLNLVYAHHLLMLHWVQLWYCLLHLDVACYLFVTTLNRRRGWVFFYPKKLHTLQLFWSWTWWCHFLWSGLAPPPCLVRVRARLSLLPFLLFLTFDSPASFVSSFHSRVALLPSWVVMAIFNVLWIGLHTFELFLPLPSNMRILCSLNLPTAFTLYVSMSSSFLLFPLYLLFLNVSGGQ